MNDKKRVTIRFQYYQLCTFDGDSYTEDLYDLIGWIEKVTNLSLKERKREISGIEGRLEIVEPVLNDTMYALNFMRLDVLSNTYIVKPDKRAKHVDLEENEYIGKNTVAIYDPKYSVLMLQCNRGSYGVSGIESYINSFNDSDELCYIRPISYELPEKVLNDAPALKLDVRFANTRQVNVKNSRLFAKIIDACNQMECYTAHFEFGLGHNKGEELKKDTIVEAVRVVKDPANKKVMDMLIELYVKIEALKRLIIKCEFDIIDDEELNERIEDLLQYLKKYENSCYTNVLGERRDELQKLVGIKYDHEEKMEF